jgi:hypothetical protein
MEEWDKVQRRASAYHEAGHAVVAYCFGWWLNPEGVEIDARQYCGLRREAWLSNEPAEVMVLQAGWLAECLHHGRREPHTRANVKQVIALMEDDDDNDLPVALRVIRNYNPRISGRALVKRYLDFQEQTEALIEIVWDAIDKVAKALLARGRLSHEDVEDLVDVTALEECVSALVAPS